MDDRPTMRWIADRFAGESYWHPNEELIMADRVQATHPAGSRWNWAVVFALMMMAIPSTRGWAQTPQPLPPGPPQDPARPLLTPVDQADENFSFLKNPSKRTDLWDPLKYVPLNDR